MVFGRSGRAVAGPSVREGTHPAACRIESEIGVWEEAWMTNLLLSGFGGEGQRSAGAARIDQVRHGFSRASGTPTEKTWLGCLAPGSEFAETGN